MAAGLLMLSAYLLVVQNMRSVLQSVGQDLSVVAFMAPGEDVEPARLAALTGTLAALPGVEAVDFVSRARALERLREDLGGDAAILDGLAENPLPASFEIRVELASRSPEGVRELATSLAALEGIHDVRYGQAWVEGYARVLRALEWIGLAFGACLVIVLAVIVAGTVRLAVFARSDEIQIHRLVGAGGLFVRLPFYLEAALQGALGAAVALGVLYGVFRLGVPAASQGLQLLLGRAAPAFFGPAEMLALVLLGIGLGLGAAVLSLLYLEEAP